MVTIMTNTIPVTVRPFPLVDFYRTNARLIVTETGEVFGGCLSGGAIAVLLGGEFAWTDEGTPRTVNPVRFRR